MAGPPAAGPSVLCGVIRKAREDLSTGRERNTDFGVLNSLRDHPSTVLGYCCAEYTSCPLWRRAKETEAEHRKFARTPEEKRAAMQDEERDRMMQGIYGAL